MDSKNPKTLAEIFAQVLRTPLPYEGLLPATKRPFDVISRDVNRLTAGDLLVRENQGARLGAFPKKKKIG